MLSLSRTVQLAAGWWASHHGTYHMEDANINGEKTTKQAPHFRACPSNGFQQSISSKIFDMMISDQYHWAISTLASLVLILVLLR